jgi:MFS transporter, FSR family, fosmidomycin resistance protein
LAALLSSLAPVRAGTLLGLRPRLWLMTFGHAVIDSNPAVLFALLPLTMGHLHIDFVRAGALGTILLVTSSVTQPLFGLLQDRRPSLPTASVGLLVAGAAMAATGFATTYAQMVGLMLTAGLGIAAFHPQSVAQAGRASEGRREWGIAVFFTGGSTGTAIMSLAVAPLAVSLGMHATLVAVPPAVVAAAMFGLSVRRGAPEEARPDASAAAAASMRAVAFPLGMLLAVSILRSAVLIAYLTFLPTLVVQRTGNLTLGAVALAAFLFAGSAGALLGGAAARAVGSRRVVVVSLAAGMIALLPVPWLPPALLIPWVVVAGVLLFASEAQVTALAQRLLPGFVGVASSLMMGIGLGLGNTGALVTGAIADRRGIQTGLTAATLLMAPAIVAAVAFASSMRRREA